MDIDDGAYSVMYYSDCNFGVGIDTPDPIYDLHNLVFGITRTTEYLQGSSYTFEKSKSTFSIAKISSYTEWHKFEPIYQFGFICLIQSCHHLLYNCPIMTTTALVPVLTEEERPKLRHGPHQLHLS